MILSQDLQSSLSMAAKEKRYAEAKIISAKVCINH
jgi:hypothetical protein